MEKKKKKNLSESLISGGALQNELSILLGDNYRLSKSRVEILKAIEETGSISKAAKQVGMSYKAVWDAVYNMQNLSGISLIDSKTGGKGGGGAALTEEGRQLVKSFSESETKLNEFLETLQPVFQGKDDLLNLMNRISVKTSARNHIKGTIIDIKKEGVRASVHIQISDELKVRVYVTNESIKDLQLKKGREIFILIKASHVKIAGSEGSDKNANFLRGQVLRIVAGGEYREINVEVAKNVLITSVMKISELENLNLTKGKEVYCSFTPSDALLGVY